MKTLILILNLLVSACCGPTPDDPFIITEVTQTVSERGPNYRIEINNVISLYTDSLYTVGDTIK